MRATRRYFIAGFAAFLILWTIVLAATLVSISHATNAGQVLPPLTTMWHVWHPYWFGVLNGAVFVVPFLLFHLPVVHMYGGRRSRLGRAILLLGLGGISWGVVGNGVWFWYNTCTHLPSVVGCAHAREAPFPSLADIGYLGMLPLAGCGLIELARVLALELRDVVRRSWAFVPSTAVALVVGLPSTSILGVHVGMGALYDPESSPIARLFSVMYIASDSILLGLAIIIATAATSVAGGRLLPPVIAIVASFASFYAADMLFYVRVANDTFYNGDISDSMYAASMLCLSLATLLLARAALVSARA